MNSVATYNLTDNLIVNIADTIERDFLNAGKDISNLAFVFGGRRPALFLKKELSKRIKKGFFPPFFFSIDDFVEHVVSKKGNFFKISDLDACFILYKLALDFAPDILKQRESFSKFLGWARELLSFIEQLDLEAIEFKSLQNLQFKAAIGYDVPQSINTMLKGIISIRAAYHLELKKANSFSRGLMYLAASEYVADSDFSEFEQIFFCDLLYLHKTEQTIIKKLCDSQKATVLSGAQEVLPAKYNLAIMSGFDTQSEACIVRELIKKIKPLDNTVIVLPEPEAVVPLLSEISCYADNFNLSMGYPLARSAVFSLFECIFRAQQMRKDDKYYAKDYLKAISHPLAKNLKFFSNPSITRVLAHKIEELILGIEKTPLGGSLFIKLSDIQQSNYLYDLALKTMDKMGIKTTWDELKETIEELHKLLFVNWEDIANLYDFSRSLGHFLDTMANKSFLAAYPLNLKMLEKIFSIKEELSSAAFNKEPFPKEDIFKIFKNNIEAAKLSFSGSPLKGLQILGLFETRSLNFENVIIMDVNESVLPNLKAYEPLIPREVMIALGLNRIEKEEEIQRYHFQRLLSSAKNVYLIYQKRDDKERSRFIEGLIWERQKSAKRLDVIPIPQASFNIKVLPNKLKIGKNPDVIKFLKGHEYSASSINTYIHCPLMFYYEYVLNLEEKEDLLDEPEGADIGTFIHELLEETFLRFINRRPYIDEKFSEIFFSTLDKKFANEFEKKMKSDAFLLKEIIDYRMKRFLENEKSRDIKKILCLEKAFKAKIKLTEGDFEFRAIVDRIDELSDGTALIIDYKTGSADILPQIDLAKLESVALTRDTIRDTVKSFQLPLYLHLVAADDGYKGFDMDACLYAIKDLNNKEGGLYRLFKKEKEHGDKEKILRVYINMLDVMLSEILNPEIPFKADQTDTRRCANCPYFYLCR